jgi:hypothetical protein
MPRCQPRVTGKAVATFLAFAAGCGGSGQSRVSPGTVEEAPFPWRYHLSGRNATKPSEPTVVAPFAEGALLVADGCLEAARRTGGKAPPCAAEVWRSDDPPQSRIFVIAGDRAILDLGGLDRQAATSWSRMGEPLSACIGPPLSLPPGRDPTGFRILAEDHEDYRWMLFFSGNNRCRFDGWLGLDVFGPGVDTTGLTVSGLSWATGGREEATRLLSAETRSRALLEWPDLPPDQRILLLGALSRDPEPEAARILRELARRDPASVPDIEQALSRRSER